MDANPAGHGRQEIGESIWSNVYYNMAKETGKHKQGYLYPPRDLYSLTCLIHGPCCSSHKCKLLNCFGTKYAKVGPFQ